MHRMPGLRRDSQNDFNRCDPGSLETSDVVAPKGTRDTFPGHTKVGGRKFYVQLRAFLHDPADIDPKPGCVLKPYAWSDASVCGRRMDETLSTTWCLQLRERISPRPRSAA